jgi:hypothetical protein
VIADRSYTAPHACDRIDLITWRWCVDVAVAAVGRTGRQARAGGQPVEAVVGKRLGVGAGVAADAGQAAALGRGIAVPVLSLAAGEQREPDPNRQLDDHHQDLCLRRMGPAQQHDPPEEHPASSMGHGSANVETLNDQVGPSRVQIRLTDFHELIPAAGEDQGDGVVERMFGFKSLKVVPSPIRPSAERRVLQEVEIRLGQTNRQVVKADVSEDTKEPAPRKSSPSIEAFSHEAGIEEGEHA